MRCAKGRIRSLPPGLSSPTTFVRRRQWRQNLGCTAWHCWKTRLARGQKTI
jgi:hypothetical protein